MSIFVIGSKPEAVFPNSVQPTLIFAANGAIQLASERFPGTPIIGVLSDAIPARTKELCDRVCSVLEGTRVQHLILLWNNRFGPPDGLIGKIGIEFDDWSYISRWDRTRLFWKMAGGFKLASFLLSGAERPSLNRRIHEFFRRREMTDLKLSTGGIATTLAVEYAPRGSDVYLIGIGLDGQSAYVYAPDQTIGTKHFVADVLLYRALAERYSCRVKFMEKELREAIGGKLESGNQDEG